MAQTRAEPHRLQALDAPTRALVELAIVIATAREPELRAAMAHAVRAELDPTWVEELILQSYLFAGFPRALNAAREWRKASGRPAPADGEAGDESSAVARWRARGEATCAAVYGVVYARLRDNIRELHPALDDWMVVDGYGKVLGRPGLDLRRRELCIVAVCAALEQDRQLHAHLHGALNVGATSEEVEETLHVASRYVSADAGRRFLLLWARVRP
jgi:4-carboxymuconolactone decarboxylase